MAAVNLFSKRSFPNLTTEGSPFFDGRSFENGFSGPNDLIVPEEQFLATEYIRQGAVNPVHIRSHSTHVQHSTPILENEEDMEKSRETKSKYRRARLFSGSLNLGRLRINSSSKIENRNENGNNIQNRSQSFRVRGDSNPTVTGEGKLKNWKRRLSGSLHKLTRTQSHSPSELLASQGNLKDSPYSKGFPPLREESLEPINPSASKRGNNLFPYLLLLQYLYNYLIRNYYFIS